MIVPWLTYSQFYILGTLNEVFAEKNRICSNNDEDEKSAEEIDGNTSAQEQQSGGHLIKILCRQL